MSGEELVLLRELRATALLAREALELAQPDVRAAIAALHDLEAEIGRMQARAVARVKRRRYPCPACGVEFDWPGELDAHLVRTHGGGVT